MEHKPAKRRISVPWRFALGSLLVVAAFGYVLLTVITSSIEGANLRSSEAEAQDEVARRVVGRLRPEDLRQPFSGEFLEEFDAYVQENLISARTARVKIWNLQGQVLYSGDRAQIGQTFEIDHELVDAAEGETSSEKTKGLWHGATQETNPVDLLEVYTPIVFPGTTEPAGVFEIYQAYEPVAQQIGLMRKYVIVTLGGGLAVLYLSLLGVGTGARLIQHKNRALARSERKFRGIVQTVDAVVWEAEAEPLRFTFVSEQAERMLGYPVTEWLADGSFWADHIHADDREAALAVCIEATAAGRDHSFEYRFLTADGGTVWVRDLVTVECEPGRAPQLRGVIIDITESKRAAEAIARLAAIVESSHDAMFAAGLDGKVTTWNSAAEHLTDLPGAQMLGRPLVEILPNDRTLLGEAIERSARGEPVDIIETERTASDGRRVALSASVFPVTSANREVTGIASIVRDITERKELEEQLMLLASRDPLTGLFNRRRFEEELDREFALARRLNSSGALLFLDLDGFKGVNDTLGHHAGDELLVSLSRLIRERVRESDIIARLGGDEFAIFLHRAGAGEAQVVARDILDVIRRHRLLVNGQVVSVSASIGIALLPDHATRPADLLMRADVAMYRSKEGGRDRAHIYAPDQDADASSVTQLNWEQKIRDALARDQFVLYAQEIIDLNGGAAHRELLLRMLDADGSVILPGAFLPVAERSGLIHAIDRWVVRHAIGLIARQPEPDSVFTLNLSGKAFKDDELLPIIRAEIARHAIDPARLVMEITETAAIADMDEARRFILALKEVGCQFAIDDFGAGSSNFFYLKQLPVDYVKIDGSFIKDLPRDEVDQHLVKAIVEVARSLGNRTIAEFVGDDETIALLREYGVNMAQGFFIGRPAPVEGAAPGKDVGRAA